MVATQTPVHRQLVNDHLKRGSAADGANVGDLERTLSLAGGGLLAAVGLHNGSLGGLALAALGGGLVARGLTGRCALYRALDVSTAEPHGDVAAVAAGKGVKVIRAVTIQRPVEHLYQLWNNLENLPKLMSHLVTVTTDGDRSHWVANGPAGPVEWDAEIVNRQPNRLIAWRSLTGSQVATAGSVHFTPIGHDRGTELRVELKYDPPGGKLGSWLAWLFGKEPGVQVREDLRRVKQLLESGEVPTTRGQSSGRDACA